VTVLQLGEAADTSVALLDGVLVLRGRVPRADGGAGDVEPGVVGQPHGLADDGARLRHREPAEGFELLFVEAVEAYGASSWRDGNGVSTPTKSGSIAPIPGPVST
jgi:hypothetical protein